MAQNLSANERIRIAADHPVTGDDIVRPRRDARPEPIVRISLRIIGLRRHGMPMHVGGILVILGLGGLG